MIRASEQLASMLGIDIEQPFDQRAGSTEPCPLSSTGSTLAPITCILGPSGSGKTTLLRRAEAQLRSRGWRVLIEPKQIPNRAPIDILVARRMTIERAMALLTKVGLGSAGAMLRPASTLSEGQRARLRLLLAMCPKGTDDRPQWTGAEPCHLTPVRCALLLDEFAASLDDLSARAIAALVARWARQGTVERAQWTGSELSSLSPIACALSPVPRAVVLATHRQEVLPTLAPDLIINLDLDGSARIDNSPSIAAAHPLDRITIELGDFRDWQALASCHYRAGAPRAVVGVLRALDQSQERPMLAGALVVSMPTLNGRWRDLAWPARFTTCSKRRAARRLNREVRCISRVVIDPRYRGLGLASRLVRAYLARPLTPSTEAITAMGPAASFFARGGMTPYPLSPSARDARLLDALAHSGVDPAHLARPTVALACAAETAGMDFISNELARWARSSRASAPVAHADALTILKRAARTLGGAPTAYVHTALLN